MTTATFTRRTNEKAAEPVPKIEASLFVPNNVAGAVVVMHPLMLESELTHHHQLPASNGSRTEYKEHQTQNQLPFHQH